MKNAEKLSIIRSYFEKQNFVVSDGIKYGVDFLLYTDSKDVVHSKYAVALNRNYTYLQLLSIQRTCNAAKKKLILIDIINEQPSMTIVERFLYEK